MDVLQFCEIRGARPYYYRQQNYQLQLMENEKHSTNKQITNNNDLMIQPKVLKKKKKPKKKKKKKT